MSKGSRFQSLPLKAAAEVMAEAKKYWTGTGRVFPAEDVAGQLSFFLGGY